MDTRLDREIALSVIRIAGLDEASIERVRREARQMARLGDHPNIVNIFDVGEEEGFIYLVAELMPGGSVDEQLNRAGGALPPERVLTIARQVAAALQYVHAEGIVHRDIKPANVWLSRDGTAKLGDFGLAAGAQASRLTAEGMLLGTVAYMAPEQATGSSVDSRSDLYSLGALLYETATGKPPFAGDDAIAVISQQINTAPVAPTWHNPNLSPGLEQLILDLLAKSPDDRPQSAADVLERLEDLEDQPAPSAGKAEVQENPLDRLAGGVFVGREAESHQLRLMLDAARKNSGGVALLVGEPGIGKTRMAEELLTYAKMKGAQVATGRCYEGEGAPAYWPWIQVIRSTVHDRSAKALASEMGSGAGYIAEIVSDVRQALPEVQSPAGSDLEASRFQLFDSVTNFLRNASRSKPMVIFLDDMHWADKPSLLLLDFLSRQLRDTRILVVCTYRDIELGRQHPLAQSLASIIREPNTRRILLRGLTEADLARYIKLTTGSEPDESLVKAIAAETEGNPFFIIETVRLLASEGRLSARGDGSWSLTIPQGVKEVIGRRLDLLSEQCNQVLTVASVLGREFELPAIELLSSMPTVTLLEALDEAVGARVLSPAGGSRYRFAHALIRETLYEELSTARRLRLHKSAGETLERLAGDDPDRYLFELAHHYFEASALGEVGKAISYARRAGDKAMHQLAFEQAAEQYDHALQALDLTEAGDGSDEERCKLLLAMGRAQVSSADPAAAHRTFQAAFKQAADSGLKELMAEAALGLGDILTGVGAVSQELVETLEAAISATSGQESALRVRLLARLGEAYRFDKSTKHKEDELSREAVSMARRVGDPLATAQALYARIISLGEGREAHSQIKLASELIGIAAKAGDVERRLLGLRMRMVMLFFVNRIPEARRDVEQYAELAAEARLPLYSWFSPLFQSTWSFAEGNLQEAAALVRDGIRQGTQAREPNVMRFSVGAGLCLAYETQDQDGLDEVMDILSEPGSFHWNWAPYIFNTLVRGDSDEAGRLLRNVVKENFENVNIDFGQLWAIGLMAEVCRRLNDTATAEVAYDMIAPFGTRFGNFGYLVNTNGCGHHHLGVLATLLGRLDDARYHLDAALELHEGAGFTYLATQTRLAQARLFQRRNAPGDAVACRKALDLVIAASEAGGFKQTLEMALELKGSDSGDEVVAVVAPGSRAGDSPIPVQASPDGTVTILFTDIEGSTELNEALGDQLWLELLADHDRIIRQEVAKSGGVVVKSRGDGFMLAFPSARQALTAAIGSQRALSAHNAMSPESSPIRVRIGVHTGEVVKQSGDFFGRHVNYASRIADKARGGEILVSELTKALVQGSPEFRFGPPLQAELKGFSGSHATFSLRWSPDG